MHTLRNPAFWAVFTLFLLHQAAEKIFAFRVPFLDSYADPFLGTPVLLTLLLWERRQLFKAGTSFTFSVLETAVAAGFLMLISEGLFPYLSDNFTADVWDLVAILLGTVYFYVFINRKT